MNLAPLYTLSGWLERVKEKTLRHLRATSLTKGGKNDCFFPLSNVTFSHLLFGRVARGGQNLKIHCTKKLTMPCLSGGKLLE